MAIELDSLNGSEKHRPPYSVRSATRHYVQTWTMRLSVKKHPSVETETYWSACSTSDNILML
jgi:hypothetical protein